MAVCQNLVPLVNIKIAGKWMFIPLKMVLIGIDSYPYTPNWLSRFCHPSPPRPPLHVHLSDAAPLPVPAPAAAPAAASRLEHRACSPWCFILVAWRLPILSCFIHSSILQMAGNGWKWLEMTGNGTLEDCFLALASRCLVSLMHVPRVGPVPLGVSEPTMMAFQLSRPSRSHRPSKNPSNGRKLEALGTTDVLTADRHFQRLEYSVCNPNPKPHHHLSLTFGSFNPFVVLVNHLEIESHVFVFKLAETCWNMLKPWLAWNHLWPNSNLSLQVLPVLITIHQGAQSPWLRP